MKRIIAIFFTIVFLFNLIGHYPVFVIRQYIIHRNIDRMITAGLDNGTLTSLSFDQQAMKSLKWCRDNEFIHAGEMYDIILSEQGSDGKIIYYCIHDVKEKRLTDNFKEHIRRNIQNTEGNKSHDQNLNKYLVKDYFQPEKQTIKLYTECSVEYPCTRFDLESVRPENLTPPPKLS